ncbi:hypothetical protein THF1D04_10727 [Vibrio owensii]|uniref:BIG2 domain-containing protein n=1 Tax=Vibrio owensii TaxID=696485 RepID=A0AAU9PYR7_9VIBR|nr:hypothetical protein THF1D04_10727 [Vibrio owensii]
MTQLFRDDESSNFFYDVTLDAKQKVIIEELVKMNREMIGSKSFGYLLYDNDAFPVLTGLDRDFFAENYMAIIEAMQRAGVYESYTIVIEQVIGDGVGIEYSSPRPRHLVINIFNVDSYQTKLITPSNLWITTPSNFGLLVPQPTSDYTLNQLTKVLQILSNPSGTYLEITFIEPVLPDSVTISDFPETVFKGDTGKLIATVRYTDGTGTNTEETPSSVVWSSSDTSILSIDQNGEYRALSSGDVTVKATATSEEDFYNNDVFGEAQVSITPIIPQTIVMSKFPPEVFKGDSGLLVATITLTNGEIIDSNSDSGVVEWSSSNDDIMTIDSNGSYSALDSGKVTITALALSEEPEYQDDVKSSSEVDVQAIIPTSAMVDKLPETMFNGESGTLITEVTYSDGSVLNTEENPEIASWSSNEESVLAVDNNGNYSALSAGNATITVIAVSDEESYQDDVIVKTSTEVVAIIAESVVIDEKLSTIEVGDTGTLTASVTYNDDSVINTVDTPNAVSWKSSDDTKLTIDANGAYNALAQSDSVTITATATGVADITDTNTLEIKEYDYTKTKLITPSNLWISTPSNLGIAVPKEDSE